MPPASLIAVPALAALSVIWTAHGHRIQTAPPHAAPALLEVGQELPTKTALLAPLLAATASSALAPSKATERRSSRLSARRRPVDEERETHVWDFMARGAKRGAVSSPGKRDVARMPRSYPEEDGPRLEEVPARIMGIDPYAADPWRDILLPADWAWILQPGSAEFIPGEEIANPMMVGVGRTTADIDVKFGVWQTQDPATHRHLRLSEMLSSSGAVPRVLDVRSYLDATYVLTESPGTRTLASLISQWERRGVPPGEPVVALERALPLMVDMLEGLQVINAHGISHGDLTESNIYVVEDAPVLTMFDDFRSACVANSPDDDISCRGLAETLCGSAFRHAPDMAEGVPTHVSANVYQLGLVFANLLLGDFMSPWRDRDYDDVTATGRQSIRDFMRRDFSIWEPGFAKLDKEYGDVLRIIAGMLEKDPRRRMTAQMAVRRAMQVAARRGIPLAWERPSQGAAREWGEDYARADRV